MDRFEIFNHLRKLCVTDLTRDETYQLRLCTSEEDPTGGNIKA